MGLVKTKITLKNVKDIFKVEIGLLPEHKVRQMTETVLVDTGAWTLVINETTREKLGLDYTGKSPGTLADGKKSKYNMAGPVEVLWKDRHVICEAVVLPEAKDILLGAIPLEAMDLIVNPGKQEVVGAHGDQMMHIIYGNL